MAAAPYRWQHFFAAPHRVMFYAGASQAVLVMLFWAYDLAARFGGWLPYIDWTLPGRQIHAFLMLFGVFPFFFLGFLLTAGPRWLGVAGPQRQIYLPVFAICSGGLIMFYVGLISHRELAQLGMLVWMTGFAWASGWFLQAIRRSPQRDTWHARIIVTALLIGMIACLMMVLGDSYLAIRIALWGFLIPVYLTVSHRMIPFFTGNAVPLVTPWRPYWLLIVLLTGSILHGLFEGLQLQSVSWLIDLPLAILALYTSWRWGFRRAQAVWILAMLHWGFLWFGLGMLAYACSSILSLAGFAGLGLLPLHIVSIGFLGALLIAMATRVTLGHSGRPLTADRTTWLVFWLFQGTVLTRAITELLPWSPAIGYLLSASLWLGCFIWWHRRYAQYFLQPRADGNAG
ncbi:NnrS family protein [Chitinivorax sp. B]|uniref:NnrS family protein n=1 Tax=Chitinivorax sp. B TaxID=2502235 RepID=UPI0010F70C94|nr:NnrS family protein [Chitinivorax sp. B]